ncbi:MAG: hypothetical protein JNL62_01965 [Bryobacterales bacterium]|nr:hypothetical protein [Bryobacterales bacterium]
MGQNTACPRFCFIAWLAASLLLSAQDGPPKSGPGDEWRYENALLNERKPKPCDRAIVNNAPWEAVRACLAEMRLTPPVHPIFHIHNAGYGYRGYDGYFGLPFRGTFNYEYDVTQAVREPGSFQKAIDDLRTAFRDSAIHRVLLLTNPQVLNSLADASGQLRDYYPRFFKPLQRLLEAREELPIYRAKVYQAFAEVMLCERCDPCERVLRMQSDKMTHLPEGSREFWKAWKSVINDEVDHKACFIQVQKQNPEQVDWFYRNLSRLLVENDRVSVFRSKLHEAAAEDRLCGNCNDPCKRFLLMERDPMGVTEIPADAIDTWKTWRRYKVEEDRRSCASDLKASHPEVWEQTNLLDQMKDDMDGVRIRGFVASDGVDRSMASVRWIEGRPWFKSEFAGRL